MSGFAATLSNAERVIAVFAASAAARGPSRLSYSDLAALLGLQPAQARNLGPLLDLVREVCNSRGLPDVSTVIVASGTELPSRKSFDGPGGTWRATGMGEDALRQEQARVLVFDWASYPR